MKHLSASLAILIATTSNAQLINGSFEDNGSFSLTGWEWTCESPEPVTTPPPGGGLWAVHKEMGNVKGCWPNYLYQRIPWANDGDVMQLSGWVRSDTIGFIGTPTITFATISNGLFIWDSAIGASGFDWNYVYINDTVHAAEGDTAVVLLNAGVLAGPAFGAGWFDAIDLQPLGPQSVSEAPISLHQFLDESMVLHVSCGEHAIRKLSLFDATGRVLSAPMSVASTVASIDTRALIRGIYIVRAATDDGETAARFVRP